jgi:hypothetical protein
VISSWEHRLLLGVRGVFLLVSFTINPIVLIETETGDRVFLREESYFLWFIFIGMEEVRSSREGVRLDHFRDPEGGQVDGCSGICHKECNMSDQIDTNQ